MRLESDDLTLVLRAKRGNLDAFNELVLRFQDAVYSTALRIVRDRAAADDVAQTAFVSAWQKIETFRGEVFKPWILRIATNAAYDELRRARRRQAIPLEPAAPNEEGETIEDAEWMADETDGPETLSERREVVSALEDCLNGLPTDYRAVLTLVDVQELDYQDVSEILSVPLGTIKSRLFRARGKMRDCLKTKGELFDREERLNHERTDGSI